MNWFCRHLVPVLVFFALTVSACTKEKSTEKEGGGIKTSTQQAKEAIEEYGKRPLDEAKKAQALGEDRARAVDQAVGNMDKR